MNQDLFLSNKDVKVGEQNLYIKKEESAIQKLVADSPQNYVREAVQNVQENPDTTIAIIGKIKLTDLEAEKVFFLNNGEGMGVPKLDGMRALYDSIKNEGKDPGKTKKLNNNTGIRAMGLAANALGLIFVSKYKGRIGGCHFYRDHNHKSALKMLTIEEYNPYNVLKDYGIEHGIEDDWTIVIALGHYSEHNTFEKPILSREMDNPIKDTMENRYYCHPTTLKEGKTEITFTIENEKLEFLNNKLSKEMLEIDEIIKIGNTSIHYRYTQNWGNVIPKSGIVCENEVFDLKHQGSLIKGVSTSSSTLMSDIGAYNLRNNISIMIFEDELRMDGYREFLILDKENGDTEKRTLKDFIELIEENIPDSLRKIILESNKNSSTFSFNKDLMKELKANQGSHNKSKPKFKLNDENLSEVENNFDKSELLKIEDNNDKVITLFDKVLKKYKYIKYDLELSSSLMGINKDVLRKKLKSFMSSIKKTIKQYNNNNELFIELFEVERESSELLLTSSLNNVLFDMGKFNKKKIKDKELMTIYCNILLYFIKKLKKDITIKEDKNCGNNDDSVDDFKLLNINFKNGEDWKNDHGNMKESDNLFAIYNSSVIFINKDGKYLTELSEYINQRCAIELVDPEGSKMFTRVVKGVIQVLASYYNTFGVIMPENKYDIARNETYEDIVFEISGQQLLSNKLYINDVLKNSIEDAIEASKGCKPSYPKQTSILRG